MKDPHRVFAARFRAYGREQADERRPFEWAGVWANGWANVWVSGLEEGNERTDGGDGRLRLCTAAAI